MIITDANAGATPTEPQRGAVTRQAVVLIHGIGEQRPMATLRGFVAAFLPFGSYHSKADTISQSYELRRIKLRRAEKSEDAPDGVNLDWPETDFYEYYWAHQMYGTRIAHVTNWLIRTLKAGAKAAWTGEWNDSAYHPRLKALLVMGWLTALLMIGVVMWATVQPKAAAQAGAIVLLFGALWKMVLAPLLDSVFTDVVGDAARYLDVAPQNVARRYDVIRGGVEMLRKLHDEQTESNGEILYRYSRVVVIGHSLGSLIAYDILRHYWPEVNSRLSVDPRDIASVEQFDGGKVDTTMTDVSTHQNPIRFRDDQTTCWHVANAWWLSQVRVTSAETKRPDRSRWLVTDLITLGCPLTYAPLLLADGLADLDHKKQLRELLTCPPDRSRHLSKGHFTVKLSAEADRFLDFSILPQGAMFAITRWTNFFYTNDPVGGPLGHLFLRGIDDQPLKPIGLRSPLRAHISYWDKTRTAAAPCIATLRDILQRPLSKH